MEIGGTDILAADHTDLEQLVDPVQDRGELREIPPDTVVGRVGLMDK